ncbi:AAA family ATPase [Dolichospermum sp. FACHB-1091]|uniref:AAA family ATPase n=1 Tax=Dolichospermum sp. FACHB-1091 TaxID=2692798 RepID=UPI0016809495|nr:ATP/GTP-binding protein [Dolichospermum sp. FACHB-1091]MBD2442821.1 AAA family ATPase [Dolichospermum sp. FACHB-1091]
MLKSVKIENFRGFKSFELQQLGRINLLVGENNSGKTSILEAIQLLCSRCNLEILRERMNNRSEYFYDDELRREGEIGRDGELDIRHLFYGHEIEPGSQLSIIDHNQNKLTLSIELSPSDEKIPDELQELQFRVSWTPELADETFILPLSSNGGLPVFHIRKFRTNSKNPRPKTLFITSSSLKTDQMIELFNQVVLTPDEKIIEQALNKIDSKIQRIAAVNPQRLRYSPYSRNGFVLLLGDSNQRVPIGSMGDGIWRILGLALAIVSAKDGYLFVDEIDTGLHFTTMSGMWKMIWDTAKRLNVQVFATTHSSDCWQSLADIAEQENITDHGIMIHRIEKDKETSIVFDESEIVIAVEENIEVR